MHRPRSLLLFASIVAATMALPRAALAIEDQWRVGLGLNYAAVLGDPTLHGVGGNLHIANGYDDMFDLVGTVEAAYHPSASLLTMDASIGYIYKIDVLQLVPYVGVMVGGYDFYTTSGPCGGADQPGCNQAFFGISIPFGLNYTITRDFAVEAGGRYHQLLGAAGLLSMMTAEVRAEYTWGY